jgi:hypothetical protein
VTWGAFTDEAGVTGTGIRLSTAASQVMPRGSKYTIELTLTRPAANPPRVAIGELELRVD